MEKIHPFYRKNANDFSFYVYHVTLKEFLPSIKKHGLLPSCHLDDDMIFVEEDQEEAEIYASDIPGNETVTLRFLVNGMGHTDDGQSVLYDVTIDPSDIEVCVNNTWIKL